MKTVLTFVAVLMLGSLLVPTPADAGIFRRSCGWHYHVAAPAQPATSEQAKAQTNQETRRFSYEPAQVRTRRYSDSNRGRSMNPAEFHLHPGVTRW